MKRKINHFTHFRNAFVATRKDAVASLFILLCVTFIFTLKTIMEYGKYH